MKAIKHGTNAGYSAHRYRSEKPCPDCTTAHSAHNAARVATIPGAKDMQRKLNLAIGRAHARLADLHRIQYEELLDQERQKLGLPHRRQP